MAVVAAVPDLSQLLAWPTAHLTQAADHWETVGARSYRVAHQVWRDALTVDWQGCGAEALRMATRSDMVATGQVADQLQAAAKVARGGASDLAAARSRVRHTVRDANAAGFDVDEDGSVFDRSSGGSGAWRAARQAQAEALSADIRQRAMQLVSLDQQVAGKVTAAMAGIRDTFPQSPAPPKPPPKPKIHAVDNHTFKQDPAPRPNPADAAYERLKEEIRDHNSSPPPLNNADAVAAYNREADELNARKAALESKLGRVETVAAQKSRFVPDWAHPAPEQPHGHSGPGRGLDLSTPHAQELGTDPATGGRFRLDEAETGLRVEAQRGMTLQRSSHPGADWIDAATGETYDAVGNFDGRYLNMDGFFRDVEDHLKKAKYVPVDVSQFSAEQRTVIRRFVTGLNNLNVFIVGEY
ncbi:hypothetical protein [Mycobacterium sp. 050134]|uniref:hypothetical protein n=1 Tax=Mycobacterium sp. 050134 TaxID=3096111 RepID=UPI002ED8E351